MLTTTYSADFMEAVAIDFVERYCGLIITPKEVKNEVDGGQQSLRLTKFPLIPGGTTVYDQYVQELVDTELWREGVENTIVAESGAWWAWGRNRYLVTYDAGYATLPPALEALIEQVTEWMEKVSGTEGLRREQFGRDYAWEAALAIDVKAAPLMQQLELWRRF